MKRVLITGGTGLLGKSLIESKAGDCQVIATYLGDYQMTASQDVEYFSIDVLDGDAYQKLFERFKPQVVIHTASIGSPDYAEKNKELTWDVNVGGTKNICALCERFGSKLVHISSNGIYDGDNAPYAEKSVAKPANYYGVTKLESENIVRNSSVIHAIVRPILMYGWPHPFERGNILTFALSKLRKNEEINVYDDVFSNPLYVRHCADAIGQIIREDKYDVFNIAGKDVVSIYEFVLGAAEVFGLDKRLVKPVKQGFFNELVKRPTNTSFNTDKMRTALGLEPLSIVDGLADMRQSILIEEE